IDGGPGALERALHAPLELSRERSFLLAHDRVPVVLDRAEAAAGVQARQKRNGNRSERRIQERARSLPPRDQRRCTRRQRGCGEIAGLDLACPRQNEEYAQRSEHPREASAFEARQNVRPGYRLQWKSYSVSMNFPGSMSRPISRGIRASSYPPAPSSNTVRTCRWAPMS